MRAAHRLRIRAGGFALALAAAVPPAGAAGGDLAPMPIAHAGAEYTLFVRAPPAPVAALVLVLHGEDTPGRRFDRVDSGRFAARAGAAGVAVAYPEAPGGRWDFSRDRGWLAAATGEVARRLQVPADRVALVGFRGGGAMALRMGTEGRAHVVAVSAVAPAVPPGPDFDPPPYPVSTLLIAGTPHRETADHKDAPEIVGYARALAALHGCAGARARWLEDRDPSDRTRGLETTFDICRGGASVTLVDVRGGGETWPGGPPRGMIQDTGRTGRDFHASDRVWGFLAPRLVPAVAAPGAHEAPGGAAGDPGASPDRPAGDRPASGD